MIDIWKYQNADWLRITDVDGNVWEGLLIEMVDAGDRTDIGPQGDGIVISTADGRDVEFLPSEIKNIEEIKQPAAKAM